ncbi:unnamed protein product [Pleuronectes platessa]|uniref:Vacuole membrane protein 1 n=1 Tax=Pleuronectes platessa TaxID=8262 RepID=A0A9N7YRH9_PLEPL|nr:unnamed protein product [Pleuronectes platessa]
MPPFVAALGLKPFREHLEAQKAKLHHRAGEGIPTHMELDPHLAYSIRSRGESREENWLSWLFEKVLVIMVCFFVCSIVNSMAQGYAKRRQREKQSEDKAE